MIIIRIIRIATEEISIQAPAFIFYLDYFLLHFVYFKFQRFRSFSACRVKKSVRTTIDPDFSLKLHNLLKQDFNPKRPDEYWYTDITYIWILEGFVYLTCIMELYSRKILI